MEKEQGIIGVLLKSGILLECNYGEHNVLLKSLTSVELQGILILESYNGMSYVLGANMKEFFISEQQINWFAKNYNRLTSIQFDQFISLINNLRED